MDSVKIETEKVMNNLNLIVPPSSGNRNKDMIMVQGILEREPTILWNLVPFISLTVIQGIYLHKLKSFCNLNCQVEIIFYDKLFESKHRMGQKILESYILNDVKIMEKKGLKRDKLSFKMESTIWASLDFYKDCLNRLYELQTSKLWMPLKKISLRDISLPDAFVYLLEIFYESLIKADIVLTGEVGKGPWSIICDDAIRMKLFGEGFTPCVLSHPMMCGLSSKRRPIPELGENTISAMDGSEGRRKKLLDPITSDDFVEQLFRYLLIPEFESVIIRDEKYENINEIKAAMNNKKITMKDLRYTAYNYLEEYFRNN